MKRPRLIIADDDQTMQYVMRRLVEAEYEVVGVVRDGRGVIEAVKQQEPDIVLLDISMPVLSGIAVARELVKSNTKVKIIFVTTHADPTYAEEAFRLGAHGYVVKEALPVELPQAIRAVLEGHVFRSSRIKTD